MTTQYVADEDALRAAGITGINFALQIVQRAPRSGWQKPSLTDASSSRQSLVYPLKKRPLPLTRRRANPPAARP